MHSETIRARLEGVVGRGEGEIGFGSGEVEDEEASDRDRYAEQRERSGEPETAQSERAGRFRAGLQGEVDKRHPAVADKVGGEKGAHGREGAGTEEEVAIPGEEEGFDKGGLGRVLNEGESV